MNSRAETDGQTPLADLDLGQPDIEGHLDLAIVQRIMHQNRRRVRACYQDCLRGDRDLEGRVVMHFVVDSSGAVSQVEVRETEFDNADVEACFVRRIEQFVFPVPLLPFLRFLKPLCFCIFGIAGPVFMRGSRREFLLDSPHPD